MKLTSQFRWNGADGFLAWLDDSLQIRRTANEVLDTEEYDFKICSSPTELREMILKKNAVANKAQMVADYCWDWISKKDDRKNDIVFPQFDFAAQWNLDKDGSLWIITPCSVNEIGCIHTCQGLEVDYIGVIVALDLVARNNVIVADPSERSRMDSSIRGYRKVIENDPVGGKERVDRIIKNTYRTLMTRGMKGCYVYFCDKETEEYFRSRIKGD